MSTELLDAARAIGGSIIADRRTIHSHPELAYQEEQTSTFVQARLRDLGIPFRAGLAGTGVVGEIKGGQGDGPCVLLRADMDALPILEETPVPFASEVPGVMHACGHDAHTAILLGVARLLLERRDGFAGSVKLMFQPAEEGGAGAARMIEDGLLESPQVDAAFMLHVGPELAAGTVASGGGTLLAASDGFLITIEGRGGHAARPEHAVDPIAVGAQVVTALQTIVSREVPPRSPAVLTLGSFKAGETRNVIPDRAVILGTIRAYDTALFERIEKRLVEVVQGVAGALRAEARVEFTMRYPPTVCDDQMADLLGRSSSKVLGEAAVLRFEPRMGAEDFSFVLQKVPGAMLSLGVKAPEWDKPKPVHTATFDIDESALPVGAACLASTALEFLGRSR